MKIAIKNLSTGIIGCIILIALTIIFLLPIDVLLIKMSLSDFQSEYIGLTIKMAFIFLIRYRIIKKLKIYQTSLLTTAGNSGI
jgi:hypothetical protein